MGHLLESSGALMARVEIVPEGRNVAISPSGERVLAWLVVIEDDGHVSTASPLVKEADEECLRPAEGPIFSFQVATR